MVLRVPTAIGCMNGIPQLPGKREALPLCLTDVDFSTTKGYTHRWLEPASAS